MSALSTIIQSLKTKAAAVNAAVPSGTLVETESMPAPVASGLDPVTKKYLMYGGVGVAALAVLYFVTRKKKKAA